jgi:gliding motility-associated-like protein
MKMINSHFKLSSNPIRWTSKQPSISGECYFNVRNQKMDMRRIVLTIVGLLFFSFSVMAQRPFITNLDKTTAAAGDKLTISGINFPTSAANIKVRFGAGVGTVTYASANLLEVTIPGNATFGNVSVTNLTNGLIGYSSEFFTLSFGGTSFLSASVDASAKFASGQNGMYDLCACDFDGDGVIDAASSHNNDQASRVPVYRNTSDISTLTFTVANLPSLLINEPTLSVACGDLDGDGKPDLLATRAIAGVTPGDIVFAFRNTSTVGAISFAAPISLTLPPDAAGNRKNVGRISIIDLDGDGKPEVIASNQVDNQIDAFRNTSTVGTLSFAAQPAQFSIGGSRSFGLDVKDLNNDGFPEIVACALQQANIFVLPNISSAGSIAFGPSITLPVSGNLANLVVGDLNGDGLNDIATTQIVSNAVSVILNQTSEVGGSIAFGAANSFSVSSGAWGLDLGDLNGDGKLDLAVASTTSNSVTVLVNTSTSGLSFDRFNIAADATTRNIKIADVNADGKPDILGAGIANNNLIVIANRNCISPTITPSNATVCVGTDFTIEATKSIGHTYTWETASSASGPFTPEAETSSSLNLSSLAEGDVFIRVNIKSNDGSCDVNSTNSSQLLVTGTPPAPPIVADPSPICQGETLEIDGTFSGAKSYQWTGPDGFSSTNAVLSIPSFEPAKAGIYTLRYVTASDCLSPPAQVRAEIKSLPPVAVRFNGTNLFCEDASVALSTASFEEYEYQWVLDGQEIANETTSSLSANITGVYTVKQSDAVTGCVNTAAAVALTKKALPVSKFTSVDAICVNVGMEFTAESAGETGLTLNYAWDFTSDGTTDSTTPNATNTFAAAGATTVKLTTGYDEIAGCVSSATKTVEVRAVPVISIDTPDGTEKCPENEVNLVVADNFVSYAWSTLETGNAISVTDPGTYTLTIVDDAQCVITSTVDIVNFDTSNSITAMSNRSIIDEFDTTQFNVAGATEILDWTPITGIDDPTIANPIVTGTYEFGDVLNAANQREYLYVVTALDANGCEVSASIPLIVIPDESPQPMKSFSPNGDGIDDVWMVENVEFNPDCKVVIYDRRGRAILEKKPYNNDWAGRVNGNEVEQGVYYYVFICDDATRSQNGSILLFR